SNLVGRLVRRPSDVLEIKRFVCGSIDSPLSRPDSDKRVSQVDRAISDSSHELPDRNRQVVSDELLGVRGISQKLLTGLFEESSELIRFLFRPGIEECLVPSVEAVAFITADTALLDVILIPWYLVSTGFPVDVLDTYSGPLEVLDNNIIEELPVDIKSRVDGVDDLVPFVLQLRDCFTSSFAHRGGELDRLQFAILDNPDLEGCRISIRQVFDDTSFERLLPILDLIFATDGLEVDADILETEGSFLLVPVEVSDGQIEVRNISIRKVSFSLVVCRELLEAIIERLIELSDIIVERLVLLIDEQ